MTSGADGATGAVDGGRPAGGGHLVPCPTPAPVGLTGWPGDRVGLVYDPAGPTVDVYLAEGVPDDGTALFWLTVGVVPGAAGVGYLLRTWRRWRDGAEAWRRREGDARGGPGVRRGRAGPAAPGRG